MPHTLGPWTSRENYGRLWIAARINRKDVQIADVSDIDAADGEDTDAEQTVANAHLLAAAPDLLAACKAALFAFEELDAQDPGCYPFAAEMRRLRAAIKKAQPKE